MKRWDLAVCMDVFIYSGSRCILRNAKGIVATVMSSKIMWGTSLDMLLFRATLGDSMFLRVNLKHTAVVLVSKS